MKQVRPLALADGFNAVEGLVKASQPKSINGLTHAHLTHINWLLMRPAVQYFD